MICKTHNISITLHKTIELVQHKIYIETLEKARSENDIIYILIFLQP